MPPPYQTPDHGRAAFSRTNLQTVQQRAALIAELLPDARAIGEICCGDCLAQQRVYRQTLAVERYLALDIDPVVVAHNRQRGIDCRQGDALDPATMRSFLETDILFFGPPLSVNCAGHALIPFHDVTPGYAAFLDLMVGSWGIAVRLSVSVRARRQWAMPAGCTIIFGVARRSTCA